MLVFVVLVTEKDMRGRSSTMVHGVYSLANKADAFAMLDQNDEDTVYSIQKQTVK